jgi:hypothetical protein
MSNSHYDRNHEEWLLAEYLVERICGRAAGRTEDECLRNHPRDVYFLGNLRPRPNPATQQRSELHELQRKLAPMAFGAEFLVRGHAEPIALSVTLKWACYYRIFPTLAQQRKHQLHQSAASEDGQSGSTPGAQTPSADLAAENGTQGQLGAGEGDERNEAEEETAGDRRRGRGAHDSLFIRFRKIACGATGTIRLERNHDGQWAADVSNLMQALTAETTRAQQVVLDDPERVRTAGSPERQVQVPEGALASEVAFRRFLSSLPTEIVPSWGWEVRAEMRPSGLENTDGQVVSIQFLNVSQSDERAHNTEPFLFDPIANFSFPDDGVQPFELALAPRGFRYDRHIWGHGFNCAVERVHLASGATFRTTFSPVFRQMRYVTRSNPVARFSDLAFDPVPVLNGILRAMEESRGSWDECQQRYAQDHRDWESRFQGEYERDRLRFEDEIARFRRGVELIQRSPEVSLAFRLTNETFVRMGEHNQPEKRKESWRLFQIVFLVTQISCIAALSQPDSSSTAERRAVDIIYFPTGGGKTEAYLATLVFHCFFDRLRGKAAGVSAWTRFPLRLLTLQQTQRLADAIGIAELIRQRQTDRRLNGDDIDGFSVGYFVGAEATPNEIVDPNRYRFADPEDTVIWSQAVDPEARQRWKRVVRCPACKTPTVRVDFDAVAVRIVHRCTSATCAFPGGEIPVRVVDNEIYRTLPSVVVGTIDKLASLGNQRKLAQIFGQVDGRCSVHGYYKVRCCQKDCGDQSRLRPGIPRGLTGPTLFVQDELHLLKEGLGTFDAHYETFTQMLCRRFGQREPLKVIASSATIEAFEWQIENLYGRARDEARVFPGLGPTLGRSFYAETLQYPQRLYVGLIPHNKTIFNTILELLEFYCAEIETLQRLPENSANPYRGSVVPGTREWAELLDYYLTSITYFLAGRLLNSIRTDLVGHVNPNLQRLGLSAAEIHELTGNTGTDEVTRILERLERSAPPNAAPEMVLATSMISHGVDVDRFNAMFFYGMPRQNAEYIQASSRVGRSHVGLIFACLHPVRERDQSHFAYFQKYHEFLGQLVEPVAINRWAKFSINRTLPGLFMGVLLQVVANGTAGINPNQYYMLDFMKGQFTDGSLRADDFIPLLREAYLVENPSNVAEITFNNEIVFRVQQFVDQIVGAGSGARFVSEVLVPAPMRSLRDVDEPIDIELDSIGSQWAAQRTN